MTATPLPYFFDEASLASNAKQPGEREKALGFTTADLKWLKAVYLATQAARGAHVPGMQVDRLMLTPTIALAGAFAMSRPDDGEVTLYTPWKGLIKFADMADLKAKVLQWLDAAAGKRELLRYLSIEQRRTVLAAGTLTLTTEPIDGAVLQDQETIIVANQQHNLTAMLGELLKTPSLRTMIDDSLKMTLARHFPTLDQRHTRLDSLGAPMSPGIGSADNRPRLSSLSLSEAVLHYYLTNQWPEADLRVFKNPAHGASSDADHQAWESATKDIAQSFTPHLRSQLETFWNSPMNSGQSRADFFAQNLQDSYCVELLLKRQQGVLTTEEYLQLMNVNLAGTADAPATGYTVRIDKVLVMPPLRPPMALAATLMIGISDTATFLYHQARGIETNGNLAGIKNTLQAMMNSEGHDDNLLNVLAHEERGQFILLEPHERLITGEAIAGPVFAQLMADIRAKQLSNLGYALSRYRESAGTLEPHALLDNALDVRGLIDQRLRSIEANGRWSTRADQRWSAQPATVRADSAKQQLALLASVDHALEQQLEKHPAIDAATTTLVQAEDSVRASLALLKPKFAHTLSTALRSELKLRTIARTLGAVEQSIVQTVLDTPERLKRGALNGFLPDVFSLALKTATSTDLLHLASCFVLSERGGLDPQHSGKTILWTPALGFEAFASLTPLLTELGRRLASDSERLSILENLDRSERHPGQAFTLAPLQLIEGHFLDELQKPHVKLAKTSVEHALASALPTTERADLLSLLALDKPMTGLARATAIAQSLITRQKLPAWLSNASLEDQILHTELLAQYLNHAPDDKDYLSGIRSLRRTAHQALQTQLAADTFTVDPDHVEIQISTRAMSATRTQTLTEFALIHLHELDNLKFKPVSLTASKLPAGMDESYVRSLIRDLKLGEHQRTELNLAFAEQHADASTRKKRFTAQLPWQLLHYAHSEKLQERLSETGFDLIRQVIDMPDAIARDAVGGSNAVIRALGLLGAKGEAAINVPGVYLIGPKKDAAGPQILLAPYSPEHGIKEYENENAVLAELKAAGALQRWVLDGLAPVDQVRCRTRLGATPSLASHALKGPLFKQLFNDNAQLLTRLLGCQADSSRQSEWATLKRVLGEDLDQAFTFMSGKLAYPITVWRSYRDIKTSAEDLQAHKWGRALRAFISGMTQLAMLRSSMERREPAASADDTATQWQRIDSTAPERTRLQRHESTEVDLGSLTLDARLGLYTQSTSKQHYAPIEGKVYPLKKRGSRWIVRSHNVDGPYVRQDALKKWGFEAQTQTPRYSLLKRFKTWNTLNHGMNVEASGMPEIRQLFPVRARLIDEALDLSTTYAWNSFRNLQWLKTVVAQTTPIHQLIKDFLDVPTVLPGHITMIEKVVQPLLGGLLDPTLRQAKSSRFVVGRTKDDPENIFAFAIPSDQQKRLYLAEKFFLPKFDYYLNYLTDPSFPVNVHARATALIHELSHLLCKTEDIAYLDSPRPFADLIETTNSRAITLKETLSQIQRTSLSRLSPLNELFAIFNTDSGVWEDLGATSFENSDRAHAKVLELSGQTTLNDARKSFKSDPMVRLAVQLGNADSVAWLISHLGRKLYTSTP